MYYKFYESRNFKIINCKNLNINVQQKQNIDIQNCKEIFSRNFMNPNFMYSYSCFLEWYLYTSSKTSKNEIPILENNVFKNIKKINQGISSHISDLQFFKDLFPIIIKTPKNLMSFIDIIHEFIIGKYGTNNIRNIIPNFCYNMTIYYEKKNNSINLIQEKIIGKTLKSYINELIHRPFHPKLSIEFLKILIQIILALEISQEICYFTHYDLHAENIVLRNFNLSKYEYQTYNLIYELNDIEIIPTIIDYGHSCVMYDKGFIGKDGINSFFQYGMYPFYIPGADLFKLLIYIWINLFLDVEKVADKGKVIKKYKPKLFKKNTMGDVLFKFLDYTIYHFFGIQTINPNMHKYLDVNFLTSNYYNGTNLIDIYKSPNDFLCFLNSEYKKILQIFGLKYYPWNIKFNNKIKIQKNSIEIEKCFNKHFCCSLKNSIKNVYALTFVNSFHNPNIIILQKIIFNKKKIVSLSIQNIESIINYLTPIEDWDNYERLCNYIISSLRNDTIINQDLIDFFNKHFYNIIYHLRLYVCLKGFTSYIHTFYKIPLI